MSYKIYLKKGLTSIIILAVMGCTHSESIRNHPTKRLSTDFLEREHRDKNIRIIYKAPSPVLKCNKHRNHWHCFR